MRAYDGYFADPFVLAVDGGDVADGTGSAPGGRAFEVLRSPDLEAWEPVGGALEPLGEVGPVVAGRQAAGRLQLCRQVRGQPSLTIPRRGPRGQSLTRSSRAGRRACVLCAIAPDQELIAAFAARFRSR